MNQKNGESFLFYLINPAIIQLLIFYICSLFLGFSTYIFYINREFSLITVYIILFFVMSVCLVFNIITKKLKITEKINILSIVHIGLFVTGILLLLLTKFTLPVTIITLTLFLFLYITNNSILVHNILLLFAISGLSGYFFANFAFYQNVIIILIILFYEIYFTNKKLNNLSLFRKIPNKYNHRYFVTKYEFKQMLTPISLTKVDASVLILGVTEAFVSIILCILTLIYFQLNLFYVVLALTTGLYVSYIYKITRPKRQAVRTIYILLIVLAVFIGFSMFIK